MASDKQMQANAVEIVEAGLKSAGLDAEALSSAREVAKGLGPQIREFANANLEFITALSEARGSSYMTGPEIADELNYSRKRAVTAEEALKTAEASALGAHGIKGGDAATIEGAINSVILNNAEQIRSGQKASKSQVQSR